MMGETNDIEFLRDPDLWPNWPICPVKRYVEGKSWPECGLVTAAIIDCPMVVMLNLYAAPFSDEQINAATKYQYDSVEELIGDGWVVD